MAKTYDVHEAFIRYQEEIANSPAYAGMPDLRNEDDTIQWEAPSNRGSGIHKDTHDKRLQWWKEKAISVGISPQENKWISKTAKLIHPTKLKPCKYCGRIMDIRYCYLSKNLISRVRKLSYVDSELQLTVTTSIFELIPAMVDMYGERVYEDLPHILSCKEYKNIPTLDKSLVAWETWLEEEYIPAEPKVLGPGAMANPPDRLDGFHSFNRCCRGRADKGRSKSNLASYSTDRRAFEYWSDGNWITANKLMGAINSDPNLMREYCLHHGNGGNHPRPCAADHIGPISHGFSHRPSFQLLCSSCNSAKNNRLYYTDVVNLIAAEKAGETVVSWYAKKVWDLLKTRVTSPDDALKLSRIMRDNRYNALYILADLMRRKQYLILFSLLKLEYAEYSYSIEKIKVKNHIVDALFNAEKSTLKYVYMQKSRKVRVAFSSLRDYSSKENRNGLLIQSSRYEDNIASIVDLMRPLEEKYGSLTSVLSKIWDNEEYKDAEITELVKSMPNLSTYSQIIECQQILCRIMEEVALELSSRWSDDRYNRDFDE